jgi:PKD repeat protein
MIRHKMNKIYRIYRHTFLFSILLLVILPSCFKNEPFPTADFTFAGNNDFKVPCTVMFTNQSVNGYSWEWRFGDDSTSTMKDPIHLYTKPGKYDVYLRAYTESRNEWASVIHEVIIKDTIPLMRSHESPQRY